MKKILIVEDDPHTREIIVNALLNSGHKHKIMTAVDGRQALEIVQEKIPDLIIMDWKLPKLTGIDTIKELKKNKTTHDIPVIMCTGTMTSSEDLKTSLEAGAIDFIRKPVDKIELLARINSMLLLTEYYHEKIAAEQKNIQLQKEKHQSEINFKQKELSSLTLQMISTNRMLNEMKNLLKIRINSHSGTPFNIGRLIAMIDENLATENYWEQFKNQFSDIHPGFFEKLVSAHPDLTKNELKLCSFIKMNLSNKEIAQILNVTTDAVEKNRYRLRKKLEIAEKSLTQFINGI